MKLYVKTPYQVEKDTWERMFSSRHIPGWLRVVIGLPILNYWLESG